MYSRSYKLSTPAQIDLLGNPGDANEGDHTLLSSAINIYAGAYIKPADHIIVKFGELIRFDTDQDVFSQKALIEIS